MIFEQIFIRTFSLICTYSNRVHRSTPIVELTRIKHRMTHHSQYYWFYKVPWKKLRFFPLQFCFKLSFLLQNVEKMIFWCESIIFLFYLNKCWKGDAYWMINLRCLLPIVRLMTFDKIIILSSYSKILNSSLQGFFVVKLSTCICIIWTIHHFLEIMYSQKDLNILTAP